MRRGGTADPVAGELYLLICENGFGPDGSAYPELNSGAVVMKDSDSGYIVVDLDEADALIEKLQLIQERARTRAVTTEGTQTT